MTTDILIVSYKRDFRYLKYCLRSIAKFCTGFNECKVMIPEMDFKEFLEFFKSENHGNFPFRIQTFFEWPDKGMVHHMHLIMNSDMICGSDFVLHTDSDCVFTKPITPETFMVEGKPILYYASFKWLIGTQQANLVWWQDAVERALGWRPLNEFMRRHPAVHYREVYSKARQIIEKHQNCSLEHFMKQQRNTFPQSFAEYPTLGEIAWKYFHSKYHWIDQQRHGVDKSMINQSWSHREPAPEEIKLYESLGIA